MSSTHLVKVLQEIHYPPFDLRLQEPGGCGVASYGLEVCHGCGAGASRGEAWSNDSRGWELGSEGGPGCTPCGLEEGGADHTVVECDWRIVMELCCIALCSETES